MLMFFFYDLFEFIEKYDCLCILLDRVIGIILNVVKWILKWMFCKSIFCNGFNGDDGVVNELFRVLKEREF